MLKPRTLTVTPITINDAGVSALQTTAGAGAFLVNGALAVAGAVTLANAYRISLTSAGNVSTVNFTIVGTGPESQAQTEVIAGPNINTVTTTGYFRTITSITVSAAVGTNTKIGPAAEIVTAAYQLDMYESNTSIAVNISGTINFSVQKCFERVTAGETPNWIAGGITTQTADSATAYTGPTGAVRLVIASYSNGATAALTIAQAASR